MKAMVSSASATARTTIFHYDVQFGRFCTNKHKGRRFLPVHSLSSSESSPEQDHKAKLVSFGVLGLGLGIALLYGVGAYFNILPGSEWTAIMLTYGFPLAIIGMALKLKYAELKPVPCLTSSDAEMLREKCATPILKTGIFSIGHNDQF
ncbi:thylakoid membrane protein [Salix suchowensis]|nr:thylakoid membrane protein [Salix suchowensis]